MAVVNGRFAQNQELARRETIFQAIKRITKKPAVKVGMAVTTITFFGVASMFIARDFNAKNTSLSPETKEAIKHIDTLSDEGLRAIGAAITERSKTNPWNGPHND
ncbi:MAG: hypothetical protein ABIH99_04275 [Candidatus Micrarchaeota archaeon]